LCIFRAAPDAALRAKLWLNMDNLWRGFHTLCAIFRPGGDVGRASCGVWAAGRNGT